MGAPIIFFGIMPKEASVSPVFLIKSLLEDLFDLDFILL